MPRSVFSRALCELRAYIESEQFFCIHLAESHRHAG